MEMEIKDLLTCIDVMPDFFDKEIAFAENKRQYKKTEFYKKTKMPLKQLYAEYKMYQLVTFFNKQNLADYLSGVIDNLDTEVVDGLFDKLTGKTSMEFIQKNQGVIKDFLNTMQQ